MLFQVDSFSVRFTFYSAYTTAKYTVAEDRSNPSSRVIVHRRRRRVFIEHEEESFRWTPAGTLFADAVAKNVYAAPISPITSVTHIHRSPDSIIVYLSRGKLKPAHDQKHISSRQVLASYDECTQNPEQNTVENALQLHEFQFGSRATSSYLCAATSTGSPMTEHLGRNGFNFPLLLSDLHPAHLETPIRVIVHRVRRTSFSSSALHIFSEMTACSKITIIVLISAAGCTPRLPPRHAYHYTRRTDHELFNTVPRPFCTSVDQLTHRSSIYQTLRPPESSDSDTPRAHITTPTDHLTRGNLAPCVQYI